MREKFLISFFSIIITLGCLVGSGFVLAWAEPQLAPPDGNVSAPINVSDDVQSKSGGLGLGGIDASATTGLMVAGSTSAIDAVYPVVDNPANATSRALLATPNSAANFSYVGNEPAVNIFAKKTGLNVESEDVYGVTTIGQLGGLFASDKSLVNKGYLGVSSGYGVLAVGNNYGGAFYGIGTNSTGVYVNGKKVGLRVDNSESGFYVEAATQDYALKAVKDGNTYATLGDKEGYGIVAKGTKYAGNFLGKVSIEENLEVKGSCDGELCFGDLAENIDTAMNVEVGDIVEINEQGFVEKAKQAYSKKAIGVISNPAIVFPGAQINPELENVKRQPLALTGLVSVKVSNINGPIEIGDYITSSSIPGYGMKASTSGPVIGKALQAFDKNRGSMIILLDLDWIGSDR